MRLVLVHGFTQTHRSWDPLLPALTEHEVVALDAPGHGDASDVHLSLPDGGAWLAEAGGQGVYVGYSMGGRFCLHAALAAPARVRGLVLVSATGGIDDERERAARRTSDDALADRIELIGVPAFIDEWLAQPLFAALEPARRGIDDRLRNTASGLASSLRLAGTGTQAPLWDRLATVHVPTLVVAGADDKKFVALGERLAATVPDAELAIVDGAGHTVHLEQPERFLDVVLPWLRRRGDHDESAMPSASSPP
ncbi:MAG: 2-succinyl-6-hydroxy-2,4-cyclohexadiene-carboxylate synthase [Actinomycetota bacterium]|nr:2-succinyl-6-hydroxy-2,4-cyclohexadiene-carboxylate synthase [Actinomycetota bacterium]